LTLGLLQFWVPQNAGEVRAEATTEEVVKATEMNRNTNVEERVKGPFEFVISNNDFKMCDLKKMIFKNIIKRLTKSQFSI